jgi:hypothetical protein
MRKFLPSIAVFVASAVLLVAQNVLYVDAERGDDAQDGLSPEKALRSIDAAMAKIQPGDTLSLGAGQLFYESMVFRSSGTPWQPIIIEGNGATISGLAEVPAERWQDLGDGLFFQPDGTRVGAQEPFLIDREQRRLEGPQKPAELKVGQACWIAKGIYVRCAPGVKPAQLELRGTYRPCGVTMTNISYVSVRNLTAEYFANDGFNMHGYCRGLHFDQICARYNGDDGFSNHEDVAAVVRGGYFHHNNYGIQDINVARSLYQGVLVEHNRRAGADFSGGFRSLEDSLLRNNAGGQIVIRDNKPRVAGYAADDPMHAGNLFLKNVVICGGARGLVVTGKSSASVQRCSILDAKVAVSVLSNATLYLFNSLIRHPEDGQALLIQGGSLRADGNAYYPGSIHANGQDFPPAAFADYQRSSEQDQHSLVGAPSFRGMFLARQPVLMDGQQRRAPGISSPLILPVGDISPPEPQFASAAAPLHLFFDFESDNPWHRAYLWPERDEEGTAVPTQAVLSKQQAASGQQAVAISAQLPPSDKPRTWQLKLFSTRFDCLEKPVTELSFKIFGDGSNTRFVPRVRDKSGEQFYGPEGRLDWQGWREIRWNLKETPPRCHGGDGNQRQDGPPMEIVVDFYPQVPATGGTRTFYLDDLSIRCD